MSIETPIDRVGDGGFKAVRRGRTGDNLIMDKGGGQAKTVLSDAEGTEHDTD